MSDEIKKAYIEWQEAEDKVEKLRIWHNANSLDQGGQCLNHDAEASERVKLLHMRYLTLKYMDKGWPQSRIEIELKKLNLKIE